MKYTLSLLFYFSFLLSFSQLPEGFVYAHELIPDLKLELRYCTQNNFVGKVIDGYNADLVIVTRPAALALKQVQNTLKKQGLGILIYDAYRPQQAVNHFVKWAKQINDTLMKSVFYPKVQKRVLFSKGYIASKSRHSSGSTVDLTIINLKTGEPIDMGTPYDFFGQESWVDYKGISIQQQQHRQLLQQVMLKHGFRNYPKEWWHFTLQNEPFRNQYFNFPVE